MKKIKRMAALLLTLCLLATMLPTVAYADTILSGICGEDLEWDLDRNGTLTIYGTGPMDDFFYLSSSPTESSHPWKNKATIIKKVVIKPGATTIGDYAFTFLENMTSVTIPDTVTSIGTEAFKYCSNLASIKLPANLTSISYDAFNGCQKVTSIKIPASVTEIKANAFANCHGLTGITLPEGLKKIESQLFFNCMGLTSVMIPKSVTSIEQNIFRYCAKITTIFYSGTETQKSLITVAANNNELLRAQWHYEVKELTGVQPAYHCGVCNKNYWQDSTESHFTDVLTNNWQFTFAKYAVEQNLMAGTGTDAYGRVTFLPDKAITREEFVQVLYNSEGKPSVSSTKVFPDVAKSGWYKNAVLWAYEMGIASGMGNGDFGVGKNITRQDLAMMLYKYAKLKGYSLDAEDGKIDQFADGGKVADYAKTAMNWAVTNGILSGKGEAGKPLSTFRLDPTGTATRAECAAMLKNFMTAFGL